MIDQILKSYSEGNISDGAALAGIILSRFGAMSDNELSEKMHKGIRTIQSYRAQLKKFAPVSKFIFNNSKKLTNQQEQDPISEVLSKYGKLPLLSQIHAVFIKHQIEPKAKALEYIVQYVLNGVKCGRVRNFSQYLQYMIPIMWGEALIETAPKEDIKENLTTVIPIERVGDTPLERPSTDQDAERVWEQISPAIINQSPKATAEMIKCMIPVYKKDSTLYLAIDNSFSREWILHRVGSLFRAAFSSIFMNYEIILDQDVVSKIA
jgi:hypothetical protein